MSKVIDFPKTPVAEVINEAFFEKFEDAALMLTAFESLASAVEVLEDGGEIHLRDETHVGLVEACMALAVMFRRRTGHDVQTVSADHLAHQRQCLMDRVELATLPIPVRPPAIRPLPAEAFKGVPTADLAQAGFNYVRRSHEHIKGNCPQLVELDLARAHSLDALGALTVLIERLSGGVASMPAGETPVANAPSSETLQ